jgi:hypothetical protein
MRPQAVITYNRLQRRLPPLPVGCRMEGVMRLLMRPQACADTKGGIRAVMLAYDLTRVPCS